MIFPTKLKPINHERGANRQFCLPLSPSHVQDGNIPEWQELFLHQVWFYTSHESRGFGNCFKAYIVRAYSFENNIVFCFFKDRAVLPAKQHTCLRVWETRILSSCHGAECGMRVSCPELVFIRVVLTSGENINLSSQDLFGTMIHNCLNACACLIVRNTLRIFFVAPKGS